MGLYSEVKLNLACGNEYLEGWVNIDNCSMFKCKVDLNKDIRTLELGTETVNYIRLSHFMMYVRPEEARILLKRWYSWLKPGGKIEIETQDIRELFEIALDSPDPVDFDNFVLTNLYGNEQTSPHRWGWYPGSLARALTESGFSTWQVLVGDKKPKRDFKIIGTK